jgi:hypothetical protein
LTNFLLEILEKNPSVFPSSSSGVVRRSKKKKSNHEKVKYQAVPVFVKPVLDALPPSLSPSLTSSLTQCKRDLEMRALATRKILLVRADLVR